MDTSTLRDRTTALLLALSASVLLTAGYRLYGPSDDGPPFSPEQSLEMIEIADGFRVEPFAAEPLVADPVAMEIDEQGRIYVVEDHGYPVEGEQASAIKLLEDTDADGRPDQSTTFAGELRMPRGVMRWKEGILVTDAPDVLYFEDTDGDGQADVRRVLLTGLSTSNPQLGVNSPIYGLDNWVYVAHMSSDSDVYIVNEDGTRQKAPDVKRRNFRFHPETRTVEPLSGTSQFGHTFDAWGNHLLNSNANHLYHAVIPARYLRRNPDLLVPSVTEIIPDHGAAAEIFPISQDPGFQLFTDVGVITSACGLTCYLGGAFPPGYQGVTFVAEPVHNLVHADVLYDAGGTFVAERLPEGREFLASRDGWFRPVNFYVGPDGALYVLDFYRDIVEQPKFLSEEVLQAGKLYNGSDRGRIWRIVPEGGLPLEWPGRPLPGDASIEELVAYLERPNIWWRRNAQRLLVDRQDRVALAPLHRLVREGRLPEARVHALWTLEGLRALDADLIMEALRDESPGVRRNAIRLAELHLEKAPALAHQLVTMQNEQDPKVRFQLLLTLGYLRSEEAKAARQRLLLEDVEDEWVQVAALTAASADEGELLEAAIAHLGDTETEGRRVYFQRLGTLMGARAGDVGGHIRRIADPMAPTTSAWWRGAVLEGMAQSLRRADLESEPLPEERELLVRTFLESASPVLRRAALTLFHTVGLPSGSARTALVEWAAQTARDRSQDAEMRADAIDLLALSGAEPYIELLKRVINPQEPAPVQKAAVEALTPFEGAEVARFLLDKWSAMTPEVREVAIDALMRGNERITLLLDAIAEGRVQPSSLGWVRMKRLMRNEDPELQARGRALLAPRGEADADVGARYQAALTLPGDPAHGEEVFTALCSACHQIGGAGGAAFGPDLSTVQNRRPESIVADILLPNREIVAGYEQWVLNLESGDAAVGVIAAETPTSVTVRSMGGVERTIRREEIASMEAMNVSAMPVGMEHQIDEQAMADLLAFLRQSR